MKRLYYLDKLGWPVELVKGRWFLNFLRILIHTRKYTFKRPSCYAPVNFNLEYGRAIIKEVREFVKVNGLYFKRSFTRKPSRAFKKELLRNVRQVNEEIETSRALQNQRMERRAVFKEARAKAIKLAQDTSYQIVLQPDPLNTALFNMVAVHHVQSLEDVGYRVEPNALTRETIEKSERGECVKSFGTVEELFEELDKDDED
ncbi:MAG: hypothetical protein IMZ53_02430 [Thermoplasmata archaeon]|nr:hypothetical protein [Thermoplasmata archaeon]